MSKINSVYEMFDENKFSIENAKNLANKTDFVQKNAESYIIVVVVVVLAVAHG
jgi:hypothetical protein